jgi:hypothetical protein
MRKAPQVISLLLSATGLTLGGPAHTLGPGTTSRNDFQTEAEAARHCQGRRVVWVIPAGRVYYKKGDPEYGRGEQGAYMCEDEARGDLNRPARNGVRTPQ